MYKLYQSYSSNRTSLRIPNSHSLNFDGLKRTKIQLLKCSGIVFILCIYYFVNYMCFVFRKENLSGSNFRKLSQVKYRFSSKCLSLVNR